MARTVKKDQDVPGTHTATRPNVAVFLLSIVLLICIGVLVICAADIFWPGRFTIKRPSFSRYVSIAISILVCTVVIRELTKMLRTQHLYVEQIVKLRDGLLIHETWRLIGSGKIEVSFGDFDREHEEPPIVIFFSVSENGVAKDSDQIVFSPSTQDLYVVFYSSEKSAVERLFLISSQGGCARDGTLVIRTFGTLKLIRL